MTETSGITKPIQEALTKAGYFCLRLNSGMAKIGQHYVRLCPKGTPDLLLCAPFKPPIWVETKPLKDPHHNRATLEAQAKFAFDVEALGHKYIIATSLDDVLALLKEGQQ